MHESAPPRVPSTDDTKSHTGTLRLCLTNVLPGLVGGPSMQSYWLGYAGHPDCLGVRGGILNKVKSSGRREETPLGAVAPLKKLPGIAALLNTKSSKTT